MPKFSRETLLLNSGVFLLLNLLSLPDMKLSKVYEPGKYEGDIYALWEKTESFVPKSRGSNKSYSIVVPPPNANGNLHLGHALNHAIMDTAVRYHRLKGEAALLVPGADHAGFETQVVYEKKLAQEGKSRFDFTREELYQQIWDFVAENKDNYESQFRRIGSGVDWSRYVYTLDDKIVKRAYATFKKMWDDGLIYRGERLVNFCMFHGTAFADIEVAYQEVPGHLWHIRYPLTDGSGEVIVATTRPETMLGDTAVAVHPKDPRHKQFIGKTVKLPLTHREIPIIADDMVDREFGSGAVKITPAHDPNDFEVAKRHDLPFMTVISHEGTMTHDVPEVYRGLKVHDARQKVVDDLENQKFLVKTEDHTHAVGHCYKCNTVIEPLLREQWFVDMKPLAESAIKALESGKIVFYPESKKKQLIIYLQGLKDWNISRQIAWGIPIPAFQNVDDPEDWIFDTRVDQEIIEVEGKTYHRDPDVFDTWFSSSSWPYATLDYPDGEDFNKFYPLSLMETAADILYPWVSRMIMFGLYVTGDVPFKAVYLHGLVQDEHGAKMSKSKGNVIDPMVKIEAFGSDAVRMGLIAVETAGNNRPYDESKVVGARNFCNKLWNVARFIEAATPDDYHFKGPHPKIPADHWMLSKLQHSTEVITSALDAYRFAEAYDEVYKLLWDDLADWYIEASKDEQNLSVLTYALDTVLRLVHPFAPFVTETIWQTLSWTGTSVLATAEWPKPDGSDEKEAKTFEAIQTAITEIRSIMTALKVKNVTLYHKNDPFIEKHAALIKRMCRLQAITAVDDGHGIRLTESKHDCWLDIDSRTAEKYVQELRQKLDAVEQRSRQLEGRLSNKSYVDNAPKTLVDETKAQLEEAKHQHQQISKEIERYA